MWVKNGLDGHTQGCGQCFYVWMETDGRCVLQESVLGPGPCNGFDGYEDCELMCVLSR